MFREYVVENQIQIFILRSVLYSKFSSVFMAHRAIPDCFPHLMHIYSCVTYTSMHCTCS